MGTSATKTEMTINDALLTHKVIENSYESLRKLRSSNYMLTTCIDTSDITPDETKALNDALELLNNIYSEMNHRARKKLY